MLTYSFLLIGAPSTLQVATAMRPLQAAQPNTPPEELGCGVLLDNYILSEPESEQDRMFTLYVRSLKAEMIELLKGPGVRGLDSVTINGYRWV